MYVAGFKPTLTGVRQFASANWKNIVIPELFKHDDGYFVLRFACAIDKKKVLADGPYFFNNRPVILKEWMENYKFKDDIVKTMPLWVRLPDLPLHCWGKDSLSRIGSLIGKPLCSDECTAKQ